MKKSILGTLFVALLSMNVNANDSTGFVSTGGVEYIKNDKIAMQKERLFVSLDNIKVDYEYKNLSAQDVTETVLFPLPEITYGYEEFADTEMMLKSFKIIANEQEIQPEIHVRAFAYQFDNNGKITLREDITAAAKACGLTDKDLIEHWNRSINEKIDEKLSACEGVAKFKKDNSLNWTSQIIYSWQQTFKGNAITKIHHEYKPLIGSGVQLDQQLTNAENAKALKATYCLDEKQVKQLNKKQAGSYFQQIGYILKTGANWAKPIKDFRLTVERPKNSYVSFCWNGKGKVKKVGKNQFQVKEKNFLPQQDLDLIFIHKK